MLALREKKVKPFCKKKVFLPWRQLTALLRQIAENSGKILAVLTKPEKPVKKVIEAITIAAAISGMLSAIDLIKNWLGG
jgi:hypothetical protein